MTTFLKGLDQIRKNTVAMGGLVEDAISKAVSALVHRRRELIAEVLDGDKRIDAMENEIDQECHRLLALHQPVARDLRLVITVMKVNNELERMGDHCKNIARAAEYLDAHDPLPVYRDLEQMSQFVIKMVKDALDSAVTNNEVMAQAVRRADDLVDESYRRMFQKLQDVMYEDRETISRAVHVLTACRNLERIGDLATNIAKDTIFLVSGDQVRHGGITTSDLDRAD